jgi:hypothetical protein
MGLEHVLIVQDPLDSFKGTPPELMIFRDKSWYPKEVINAGDKLNIPDLSVFQGFNNCKSDTPIP